MLIYAVALVRCVAIQRALDFGAAYATWVACAAALGSDAYWAATCSAVLVVELVYPPALSVVGTAAVVAHCIVTGTLEAKQIGAIVISLLSLTQYKHLSANLPFDLNFGKKP